MMKTPIADNDKKLDIMDHLNQDHSDELLIVANYYGQNSDYSEARISDILKKEWSLMLVISIVEIYSFMCHLRLQVQLRKKFSIWLIML